MVQAVMTWIARGIAPCLVGFLWLVAGTGALPAEAQQSKFTGAASCGASNCHGSTTPHAVCPKRDENLQGAKTEKHAQAYATLRNEKLKSGVSAPKIAKARSLA